MKDLKDNSINLFGNINSVTEKPTKDGQQVEIKISVEAKQLDGKRDALSNAQRDGVFIGITPRQTELNTEGAQDDIRPRDVTPADGQTELIEGEE